ncbi:GDP-mannose pyrophosphatase NudK [Enterobacillus tribolii]|uniref:GDP-mannose pyrophosphatase n=1 Tax=Enterobacillus tribolii TaxID=1487935 RepID=A0A370QRU1_9GAMM|nr:GDP-mannose pyrophosphatase NudK [Enterobacillus tribolii]RDK91977.1 nudix-type nucleoside diphosphatase (YffH/AdpP family) [Enterobacillus tribolii]
MKINMISDELLSDNWFVLRKYVFDLPRRGGGVVRQMREVYDRGNGATILLYNLARQSVILTRQFRLPTYLNGNPDGMLLEACAGLLDGDEPEACVRREAMEETGFHVGEATKLFEAYMSPGGVTELIHFFAAPYEPAQQSGRGGGIEDEDIEVVEMSFVEALSAVRDGRIKDGKTIMLLQYAQLQGWCNP